MGEKKALESRRKFLAVTGLAALSAKLRSQPADEPQIAADRIDCQSHIYPPEMLALL